MWRSYRKNSQFMDHHIQPLVPNIKSYLRDTKHLIQVLENNSFPTNCILISIDVKSLYLNIQHEEGIQAALNRAYFKNKDSSDMKIPPESMRDLLDIVLTTKTTSTSQDKCTIRFLVLPWVVNSRQTFLWQNWKNNYSVTFH